MNWKTRQNQQLVQAFLALETTPEAQQFLRDLMTESEITEFGKRLEAARLLSKQTSYAVVQKQTGLSSTTVARVSKWLTGSLGGYRLVLDRLRHYSSVATGDRGMR